MLTPLDPDHILLGQSFSSKREVVQAIGELMVASGDVTPRYVEGMLQKEELHSTWITESVALPHGVNDVKREVIRTSVVLVQLPKGVDWGGGKIVHLAIGVAGQGEDQHVKLLTAIARVLQNRNWVAQLKSAVDREIVLRILGEGFR
jgi:mannitol/fructose-specific phosphotransferase system IIA component